MAGVKFHEAHLLMPYLPPYHQDDNVAFGWPIGFWPEADLEVRHRPD